MKKKAKKTVKNRGVGNITQSVGYSSQNIKFVTHVNVPTLKVTGLMPSKIITDKDGHYFMLLTKIFREVHYNKLDYQPEAMDFGRISEWGARIPKIASNHPTHDESNQPYNVFESITYALTYLGEKEDFLTCHIDTFNENKDGMNVAICLYFNFYHKQAKKYCRVALLGYFRRAISEYYARLRKRNVLRDNLKSYYLNLGNRKTLTYEKAIPKQIINKPIFHFGVACVDKCAFYSLFVHSVNILISSFKRNNRKLFLQDIIEIVTPIGWIPTPHNYFLLLKEWSDTQIPCGNLTVLIVTKLVEKFGSLCGGKGQRFTVTANKEISKWHIYQANKCIYDCIIQANSTKENIHGQLIDSLVGSIYYVGQLTAQHILSILTIYGVIHNKDYLKKAFLAKGTKTHKVLRSKFGLHEETVNSIYEELSDEYFQGMTYMAENLACEYIRDMGSYDLYEYKLSNYKKSLAKRKKNQVVRPDTFHGQGHIFKINNCDGRIYEHYMDDGFSIKTKLVKEKYLRNDKGREWMSAYCNMNELRSIKYQVTKKNIDCNEVSKKLSCKKRKKLQTNKKKKTKHEIIELIDNTNEEPARAEVEYISTKNEVVELYESDDEDEIIEKTDKEEEATTEAEYITTNNEVVELYESDDENHREEESEYTHVQKMIVELAQKKSINDISSLEFKSMVMNASFANHSLKCINVNKIIRDIVGYPSGYHRFSKKDKKLLTIHS